jgi:hypothetical protein
MILSSPGFIGLKGLGKTREGDGRTPTGVFHLTTPFGILDDPGANMEYTKVTKYHYWCGESNSKYYNQLVDERTADRKHTSADEYLIDYKGVYNYCMFIDYNAEGTPHRGSCIFLHCTGKNKYTAGCVAVPEKTMKKILQWAGACNRPPRTSPAQRPWCRASVCNAAASRFPLSALPPRSRSRNRWPGSDERFPVYRLQAGRPRCRWYSSQRSSASAPR